ncbi:MAG: hypothetical protein BWY76_02083 [bacterium ADurb.Bin429]|nr:MAG: hypothetical protein BWY76_02083 [bacterium ADurb.Bin429]
MNIPQKPTIFISYVRQNEQAVAHLIERLDSPDLGFEVWCDQKSLLAGRRWKAGIKRAIANCTYFLACFSAEYQQRHETTMNEELAQAIARLRKHHYDYPFLIPVLLNQCVVPDNPIGPDETLHDLQWVEMYPDWDTGMNKLLAALRVTGEATASPTARGLEPSVELTFHADEYDEYRVATLRITIRNYDIRVAKDVLLRIHVPPALVGHKDWRDEQNTFGESVRDGISYRYFEKRLYREQVPVMIYPNDEQGYSIDTFRQKNRIHLRIPDKHAALKKGWRERTGGDSGYPFEPALDDEMVKNAVVLIEVAADGFPLRSFAFSLVDLITTAVSDNRLANRPPITFIDLSS